MRGRAEECQDNLQNGTISSVCPLSIASPPTCACILTRLTKFNKVFSGKLDMYTVTPNAALGVCQKM